MPYKILIIDDDAYTTHYYKKTLDRNGFTTLHCTGIDMAFTYIDKESFDLIILDVMMPPGERYTKTETDDGLLTGTLVYRDVRQRDPNVPMLVLTNVSNPDILDQFQVSENDEIRQKSATTPKELARVIQDIFSRIPILPTIGGSEK